LHLEPWQALAPDDLEEVGFVDRTNAEWIGLLVTVW